MTGRGFRIGSGLVAAGVILGGAEIVAAFISPDATPFQAVGAWVIDHTPDGLREWAIDTFGTNDKLVLFVLMGVVAVLLAAVAGLIERPKRPAGSVLFGILGLLSAVAAVTRPHATWNWLFPSILGAWAGIMVLRTLIDRIADLEDVSAAAGGTGAAGGSGAGAGSSGPADHDLDAGAAGDSATSPGTAAVQRDATGGRTARTASTDDVALERRLVVRGIAVAAVAGIGAGIAGRVLEVRSRSVAGERAEVVLPTPKGVPVAVDPAADLKLPGLTPYLTPNSDFYRIDTALTVPQLSRENWSLRIHGMVDREIRLSWADLDARTPVERLVTLACVSNPVGGDLIGNAQWLGYRLDELIAEAGPHPDADMVLSRSVDGFTAGSPLAALTDGRDALLAVGMNGEPLPTAHGYPARLVVPGLYGYVSATKWVTELEITRFDRAQAYWTKRGWSAEGPIKTGTRIDTPRGGTRAPGVVTVAGVAWAQHRGIRGVEVRVDNGEWQPARLAAEPSIDTWRQWAFDWQAEPGVHTLWARATDGTGETQTADRRDVIPDGASGYPSVTIRVNA
ncbi:molybdopterin-dependent oxidoreductase [Nocardia sp. NPDC057668]|uniref:molybdopterin-dependent oxidoreductase n=1 Tax=Nocardia sp. NPDC057668 TaxID=3346202 RepID=UPI00366D00FF